MPLDDLFDEARRQLTVCNSCRYCAGYCPVWPALELRPAPERRDITHLANLCHDCGDCLSACMYAPPHEFAVAPPSVFADVRKDTYRRYVWPRRAPGRLGTGIAFAAVCLVLALLSRLFTGRWFGAADRPGDPYEVLPHVPLLIAVGVPGVWALAVFGWAALRYWRDIHGRLADLFRPRAWRTTFVQAVQLRHMEGGGAGCEVPGRRGFHLVLLYGFGLCAVSTTAAALLQNVLGAQPPYSWVSVPVISGGVGGIAMLVGGTGLWVRGGGSGFLWSLLVLAATGMLTLLLRETVAFGPLLLLHVAAVVTAFGTAPYSKFVHWIFRMLSIHHDNLER
ncbi:tricarballylate utilization 4Fe-4S protein TcuB [Streptomyces cylindrosporus]|uniref:Tricarballylate utilization 4Fe-4S protein TcuB n=1 Tax=Streptomyces cylindrosporus TaxID=2927583 RepID=A0ABS9YDK1_9ACTN|nr:tricarballylate utilization 4Fe-4S protein TcuB [Streptomyces cylindrosporus]MCI3275303.1 tricarballylate utilization 4Fe-4S protein TcuB [Streptomyces cylindrosporus]